MDGELQTDRRYRTAIILILLGPVLLFLSVLIVRFTSWIFLVGFVTGGYAILNYYLAHIAFCVGLALLISKRTWVVVVMTMVAVPPLLVGSRAPEIYADHHVELKQDLDLDKPIEIESGSNIKLTTNVERIYARKYQYGGLAKNCADAWCFGFSRLSAPDSRSGMFWSEVPKESIEKISLNAISAGPWEYELAVSESRLGNAKKVLVQLIDKNGRELASRERYYRDDFVYETRVDSNVGESSGLIYFYEYLSKSSGIYRALLPPTVSTQKNPIDDFLKKNVRVLPKVVLLPADKVFHIHDERLSISESRMSDKDRENRGHGLDAPEDIESYATQERCHGIIEEVTDRNGIFYEGSWKFSADATSAVRVDGRYITNFCSDEGVWFYAMPYQGAFELHHYTVEGKFISALRIGDAHDDEASSKVKQASYWYANALLISGRGQDVSHVSLVRISDPGDEKRERVWYRAEIAVAPPTPAAGASR